MCIHTIPYCTESGDDPIAMICFIKTLRYHVDAQSPRAMTSSSKPQDIRHGPCGLDCYDYTILEYILCTIIDYTTQRV